MSLCISLSCKQTACGTVQPYTVICINIPKFHTLYMYCETRMSGRVAYIDMDVVWLYLTGRVRWGRVCGLLVVTTRKVQNFLMVNNPALLQKSMKCIKLILWYRS